MQFLNKLVVGFVFLASHAAAHGTVSGIMADGK